MQSPDESPRTECTRPPQVAGLRREVEQVPSTVRVQLAAALEGLATLDQVRPLPRGRGGCSRKITIDLRGGGLGFHLKVGDAKMDPE